MMHYIAVRTDCNVVHPEAICSRCLVFIRTLLFLSFCYAPKDLAFFLIYMNNIIYTTLCKMQQIYYIHNVVQMQLISYIHNTFY